MVNKTISLSLEIFNKLKEEENASALIDKLLKDFYKEIEINSAVNIDNKLNELEIKRKELIEKLDSEKKQLTTIKVLKEREIETIENQNKLTKEQMEEQEKISEFVKQMTEAEREEFLEGRKLNKWGGMLEYARTKLEHRQEN